MNNPICPHCEYEFDDDETWHSGGDVCSGDVDTSELVCHNLDCKKTFHVICRHDIKWTACDEDGQDIC